MKYKVLMTAASVRLKNFFLKCKITHPPAKPLCFLNSSCPYVQSIRTSQYSICYATPLPSAVMIMNDNISHVFGGTVAQSPHSRMGSTLNQLVGDPHYVLPVSEKVASCCSSFGLMCL